MKKLITITIISVICFSAILAITNYSLAFTENYGDFLETAGETGTYDTSETGQGSQDFLDSFIGKIITTIVSFIGVIFFGLIFYSGFQWMTAGGNEEKISTAKKRIVQGIIGVAITLLAFILTFTLFSFLNAKFLKKEPIPPRNPNTAYHHNNIKNFS